jgi:hypothetical protein
MPAMPPPMIKKSCVMGANLPCYRRFEKRQKKQEGRFRAPPQAIKFRRVC